MSRPPHLQLRLVGVVALGGALGTTARRLLTTAAGVTDGWPVATFAENMLGSFLLGVLLEALVRRGAESRRGRVVRLGLGTGVLGGFTTFSSLALELDRLLAAGAVGTAAAYAVTSLVLGTVLCLLGTVVASRHHAWRHDRGTAAAGADPVDRATGAR